MNREIKFRAWDEQNKVMHNDFQFVKSGNEGNDWILFVSNFQSFQQNEDDTWWYTNPYFQQQLKIMQFTGLHDKNGKEIYEGDIVRYDWGHSQKIDGVTLDNFRYWLRNESFGWEGEGMVEPNICEVIGNIYENSELLK